MEHRLNTAFSAMILNIDKIIVVLYCTSVVLTVLFSSRVEMMLNVVRPNSGQLIYSNMNGSTYTYTWS